MTLEGQLARGGADVENAAVHGQPVLEFDAVTKRFDNGVTAVDQIDLSISDGEFVCLVGPSGCGKSTMLNMAAGIMSISEGAVRYKGEEVSGPNRSVGYITQKDLLLPWRTVLGNVRLPLELHGIPRAEREELAVNALKLVGLERFRDVYPSQLSGGMRKRVGIARTFVYGADTLLMDEPFGSLDAQLRLMMHQELLNLWEGDRTSAFSTVVFVTHDLVEAISLADRVVVMSRLPGRVKLVRDVPIERPRDVVSVQTHPEFADLFGELWRSLDPPEEGLST